MSGNYGSPPYVPESVPSTMGELCFNFKRRRVPGPPASISVTKCPRMRKYVPPCHNRSFFPLNVFYCCRHTLSFRLPLSRLSRAWINARRNAQSEPFQFARAITRSKWRRKRRKRKILSLPSRFRPKKVRNASCSRVQWATELRLNFWKKVCLLAATSLASTRSRPLSYSACLALP